MSSSASRRQSPHQLLGLPPGASAAEVRAARRRLAREHHPDRFADNPAAARAATRQMARINAAAEELLGTSTDAPASHSRHGRAADAPAPRGGHRPAKPVTGRVVVGAEPRANARTSDQTRINWREASWQPRDYRTRRGPLVGTPAGPVARRIDPSARTAPQISIGEARALIFPFGKYAGATVGDIARRDPGYLAWCVDNVRRDPMLVRAADLLLDEAVLHRGIRRPKRGSLRRSSPVAFDASDPS